MDITALIASDTVSPGDVLLLEDGLYFQTVNVTKKNIRIIAKGRNVVFYGNSRLLAAFVLSAVSGVEINGITMQYYSGSGVIIDSGNGNRIVNNKIVNMINYSITISSSSANLLWKNDICNVYNGIRLFLASTNNRIIENTVKDCYNDAFETFSEPDSNNVFISNTAIGTRGYGMIIYGRNNLLLNNVLIDNGQGGVNINAGNNTIAINNIVKNSKLNGYFVFQHSNVYVGGNQIECNLREGMLILDENGIFQDNHIAYNGGYGISLATSAANNLFLENTLKCNIPANIVERGIDNVLIGNADKPCEPCELPGDKCDNPCKQCNKD